MNLPFRLWTNLSAKPLMQPPSLHMRKQLPTVPTGYIGRRSQTILFVSHAPSPSKMIMTLATAKAELREW